MTRQQLSLLLYLESRGVNHGGAVALVHMNEDDIKQAEAWNGLGLIQFGRITSRDIRARVPTHRTSTHWVKLSPQAQTIAAAERAARAERGWKARTWRTTAEKRGTS